MKPNYHLDNALDKLWSPATLWVMYGGTENKQALIDMYNDLSVVEKEALAESMRDTFQRIHNGSTAILWRRHKTTDGNVGGLSMTTHKPVTGNPIAYRVHRSEVMLHWAQPNSPLATKAFGHEHEVILLPHVTVSGLTKL